MRLSLFSDLLAVLSPCACAVCDRRISAGFICTHCLDLSQLVISGRARCSICSIAYHGNEACCPACAQTPLLVKSVRALVWYRDASAWLLRAAKYKPSLALTHLIARTLAQNSRTLLQNTQTAHLVIAVPASRTSLRQRGFNQSLVLAKAVATELGLPLCDSALKIRKRFTRRALLSRDKRSSNLAGSFCAEAKRVALKRILLVDDIVTSGATAAAATRALLRAGASSVQLLCFARAPGELTNLRPVSLRTQV